MMDAAATSERISRLKEVIPIELGLREAGFVTDPSTDLLAWGCRGLKIAAGEGWPYGWSFIATGVAARTALCDEFRLPGEIGRGELLARLVTCWRELFKTEPVPVAWQDGLLWEQFQAELRRVNERATMRLRADTSFLRLTINHLKESHVEPEISLGFIPGQLVVTADDIEYHVPAYGRWLGWCKVRTSEFLGAMPARLPARSTPIEYAEGVLLVAYRPVQALWHEED